jgi:hypothetical protein
LYPKELLQKIESLSKDKRERILKFIQREEEVGRQPATSELQEIVDYLVLKQSREIDRSSVSGFFSFSESEDESDFSLKDSLQKYNCELCIFRKQSICSRESSILFKTMVDSRVVCNCFENMY